MIARRANTRRSTPVRTYRRAPKPQPAQQPIVNGPAGECPVCELTVGLRADGVLRSHRVGHGRNSWPCPGVGREPKPTRQSPAKPTEETDQHGAL